MILLIAFICAACGSHNGAAFFLFLHWLLS